MKKHLILLAAALLTVPFISACDEDEAAAPENTETPALPAPVDTTPAPVAKAPAPAIPAKTTTITPTPKIVTAPTTPPAPPPAAKTAAPQATPAIKTEPSRPIREMKLEVSVLQPYAFATAKEQKNGAVFLKIYNITKETARLIDVKSAVADTTELHVTVMEAGTMKMRKVEAVDIAPRQTLQMKPSGYHVMLMGLKAPLTEGQSFPLTLVFEGSKEEGDKEVTADVIVQKPGTAP
jgi:periplasmic copper chaperone A